MLHNDHYYFVTRTCVLHAAARILLSSILLVGFVFCSPMVLAQEVNADAANNGSGESLQQQLQTLQESIQASPTKREAPKKSASAKIGADMPLATAGKNNAPAVSTAALPPPSSSAAPIAEGVVGGEGNGEAATVSAAANPNPAPVAAASGEDVEGDDMRSQAFGKMLTTTLPLSPSQIRMLRSMYDATQQAAASYPGIPPRPTASSLVVNLSPGATPPVVRLGAGFITSLVFVDSTGAPWPIDSYSLGNPTAFNIQWDKKGNILLVQAITAHRMGNLAVILKGLNTPVMLDLNPGQAAMDVRVDLRIPGLGPQAKPSFDMLPGTESPALLALLDGIPPPGAKSLKSSACENCAWMVDKKLYLRTQFSVLSPAWISTLSSADGTHVYEMQLTPLVLASYNGKTIKMRIEGF